MFLQAVLQSFQDRDTYGASNAPKSSFRAFSVLLFSTDD
jgi:hypothetical protein